MDGFSIIPLAQKARTETLIVDSDLNLGSYDLICTDAKGDTAEFTEFVGGVGNFTNVLGSGNLDIEGTASIKGNTQIDGNLVLEGAINNVNIADNGEITTSRGVNAASFNGVPIKNSGVITVTPTNEYFHIPLHHYPEDYTNAALTLLPMIQTCRYTGTLRITFNTISATPTTLYYWDGSKDSASSTTLNPGENTFSFERIHFLILIPRGGDGTMLCSTFTLS